jgi:2-polyprenyl-3-methyl-5-hydroxy-6-metoxy-1,4-benzoquinol methylase
MAELTTQEYWGGMGRESSGVVGRMVFSDLFSKHIKKARNGESVIEIGCVPGQFLAYISKNFGYFPEGVDYVKGSREVTGKTLKENGINDFRVYEKDFLRWKSSKKYPLVTSFGFIEHFDDPISIVKKHIDLLSVGGTLLIEVPNFNGLRYFVSKHSDIKTLNIHNMQVMSLSFYRHIAKIFNLKIKYLGYCGGFEYNWGNHNPTLKEKLVYAPFKILSKVLKRIPMNSKFMSAYIVFIAEKA